MTSRRSSRVALVLIGSFILPALPSAATLGSALSVKTEVAPTCILTGTSEDGDGSATAAPAISLTCTRGVSASVSVRPSSSPVRQAELQRDRAPSRALLPAPPGERPTLLHAAGARHPRAVRQAPTARDSGPLIATIQF